MGIHGLLRDIGPGQRISLAKLSSEHYTAHSRPFRLAIDISIWLFQIQSGKGGSNPALRTFYYRLLRLLSLNIHPLFVFDGPNKPLFKRHKKVGGPGVRVASVPEFLAKQLLKQFGFPWHVAPGEAEAECALLQREGLVDVVLSEDVDTLMFGSGVTLRNWTSENSTKSPTHVNVYRAEETKKTSGLDREGMILVALMSGGDYVPEGIPGCGPKVACDAARAGYGKDLVALKKSDTAGLKLWRDRLQHQLKTNEAKYFSRKNSTLTIPEDFPNQEVQGYYMHPCVSSPEKLARLRRDLKWDHSIDFAALRTFTADAFDWRCLGGAKKFIRNLAPAMLVRELRLRAESDVQLSQEAQEAAEEALVKAIHGKRNHNTTDGELELRISFTPASLVPIDLGIEEEDDDFRPAGGEESDAESEAFATLPSSTADEEGSEAPSSPSKKRNSKPFDPSQPEKLWVLKTFLSLGCPMLVEDYEASLRDPKAFLKQRQKARSATNGGDGNIHTKPKRAKKVAESTMPENALHKYTRVTKASVERERRALKELNPGGNGRLTATKPARLVGKSAFDDGELDVVDGFRLPSTQVPAALMKKYVPSTRDQSDEVYLDRQPPPNAKSADAYGFFAPFASSQPPSSSQLSSSQPARKKREDVQRTPKGRKRRSPSVSSPAHGRAAITSYFSLSPRKTAAPDTIDLLSSPVSKLNLTPSPPNLRHQFVRSPDPREVRPEFEHGTPDTITKRTRRGPLKKARTAPVHGRDDEQLISGLSSPPATPRMLATDAVEAMDLASPTPRLTMLAADAGGFFREDEEEADETTMTPKQRTMVILSSSPVKPSESHVGRHRSETATASPGPVHLPLPLPMPPEVEAVEDALFDLPLPVSKPSKKRQPQPKPIAAKRTSPKHTTSAANALRRSPRQAEPKKLIHLRNSLEGFWKEVDAENVDLTGDGSGWAQSKGKAKLKGVRKSGVEVLDLTGA